MEDLLKVAHEIAKGAATFGTSGNASMRESNESPRFWLTPSGVPWETLLEPDLVLMDGNTGEIVKGSKRPSSEWRMHQTIYARHSWVGGIVHLHPPYATVLSTLMEPVRPVHYQMARRGDEIPVVSYFTFGSSALAEAVSEALGPETHGVLLANHGLVAVASTVADAWRAAEEIEWTAMIQYRASLVGSPKVLRSDQLEAVRQAFRDYGQEP